MIDRLLGWEDAAFQKMTAKAEGVPLLTDAVELLKEKLIPAAQRLTRWRSKPLPLQCIVGDLWAEHVLFTGDQVTGLIDLATVRLDHPAHDVARLLGSYCQGDATRRAMALNYYPPLPDLEPLVNTLDEAGTVVALGNWLRWLALEQRPALFHPRALDRLQAVVNRLQRRGASPF